MSPLPEALRQILPEATQTAWTRIVSAVPPDAYLVGGTALAVHLGHRESRDLDFFTTGPFDPHAVQNQLERLGRFAPTLVAEGTLNGVFEGAKVQFLDASAQRVLEPLSQVEGLRIAGVGDLLASKLKVIGDRELRDYFDVWRIEADTGRTVEEGLELFVARYSPNPPAAAVAHLVRALGYLDDVADDPFLPASRADITRFWRERQPQIVAHLNRQA